MSRGSMVWTVVLLLALSLMGCQKKVAVQPSPVAPAPTPAERLEAGKKAFVAGDCAKAMPALEEATRLLPDAADGFLYLGLCAALQKHSEQAETALGRAASLDPQNPRPVEALGILHYADGKRDAAKASLNQAVALNSVNPQVFYYLGNLAMFAGDCPSALVDYRRALLLDASFAPAIAEYKAAIAACAKAHKMPHPAP